MTSPRALPEKVRQALERHAISDWGVWQNVSFSTPTNNYSLLRLTYCFVLAYEPGYGEY
jgi:hypothetical protein